MKDKYDLAVAYLTENPQEIFTAWQQTGTHRAGCLFKYIAPDEGSRHFPCGCMTMIRADEKRYAVSKDGRQDTFLTSAIRSDKRIPEDSRDIGIPHLPVFAEWQRRIDKYYETGILEREEAPQPKPEPEYRFIKKHESIEPLLDNVMYQS